jgi:Uma2 family endonuclease
MQRTPVLEQELHDQSILSKTEIYYPESDGKPMGETGFHIAAIFQLWQALRFFFRHTADVYVGADMLFYYEEGEPTIFKVPDVFVAKGVDKAERRIYKLWEEKAIPSVIFEVTSRSTRYEDVAEKKGLYEFLGVTEYFLFDPLGEYLKPRMQGFRLVRGHYEPIALTKDGALTSQELGVILRPDDAILRVIDLKTGKEIPSLEEATDKTAEALERAQVETQRAQAEAQRAQVETQRAQAEAQRAQAEAQRADAAEAELARLRAELEQLKRQQTDQ